MESATAPLGSAEKYPKQEERGEGDRPDNPPSLQTLADTTLGDSGANTAAATSMEPQLTLRKQEYPSNPSIAVGVKEEGREEPLEVVSATPRNEEMTPAAPVPSTAASTAPQRPPKQESTATIPSVKEETGSNTLATPDAAAAAVKEEEPNRPVDKVEYDGSYRKSDANQAYYASSESGAHSGSSAPSAQKRKATSVYGMAQAVESTGGVFPAVGSTLGPYFCLGQLGKGTFSSIHKCISLAYYDKSETDDQNTVNHRLAAAKVELSAFRQSGVLESEAVLLDFLYRSIPQSVPAYFGHYKTDSAAALVMEYLTGQDMHVLREETTKNRRIDLDDAILLTAHVMLPLLRDLHMVGIVHRDVKPSNVVLKAYEDGKPQFCLVDFGLSKSVLVPADAPHANPDKPWEEKQHWLRPQHYNGKACFRKAREVAEFRGTSMYASVHVHQLKDYCFRDDMYSLLYVFCDLVSGDLPWMSYAANRDRAKCQEIKEQIHYGNKKQEQDGATLTTSDETYRLLQGDAYHTTQFRKQQNPVVEVPQPLAMSKDPRRIALLCQAFEHLDSLQFGDMPDYAMLQECIENFAGNDDFRPPPVPRVDFSKIGYAAPDIFRFNLLNSSRHMPKGCLPQDSDPLNEDVFEEVQEDESTKKDKLSKLPIELRFRLSQMEYHMSRPVAVSGRVALRDWMKVTLPLLFGEWDTPKFEGRHRTSTDGLKRELYLQLLEKCRTCAAAFGNFQTRECYPKLTRKRRREQDDDATMGTATSKKERRSSAGDGSSSGISPINVSRALFGLRRCIQQETGKKPSVQQVARISF